MSGAIGSFTSRAPWVLRRFANLRARLDDRFLDRLVVEAQLQPDLAQRLTVMVLPHGLAALFWCQAGGASLYTKAVESMVHSPLSGADFAGDVDRLPTSLVEVDDLLVLARRKARCAVGARSARC